MDIVLQQDFPSLGYTGDKVKVKPGYARNFLIPRGIAVEISSWNANLLKHRLAAVNAKRVKLKAEAEVFAKRLEVLPLEFTLKFGAGGKSFGSVTARDIFNSLEQQGVQLDRKQVRLLEPLRTPGEHQVEVRLHSEVVAPLKVRVVAERPVKAEPKAEGEGAEDSSKRRRSAKSEEEGTEEAAESSEESASEKPAKKGKRKSEEMLEQ